MSERLRLPGPRDVRATLDGDDDERVVLACPPHPQYGGDRRDSRLRALVDALGDRDIDCLRFDYGPWDEGEGETTDALTGLAWCREQYDTVGLAGYSFGAGVALHATANATPQPDAVSVLAPPATLPSGASVAALLDDIDAPVQVVYGERDDTVDWQPVVDAARARAEDGDAPRTVVSAAPADHFFVGQQSHVADRIGTFFAQELGVGQ